MKKQLHFILCFVFLSFYSYSQCTLEMQDSITVCTDSLQNGDFYLGDYFNIQGGTAPYEYTWSADYQFWLINTTASDILNDTTSANPNIIAHVENPLTLYLDVTDANGQVCSDSTVIQFCSFFETLGPHFVYINEGDTTTLQPGVDGTCGIAEYHWTPNYNLSNPNIPNPQASPDTTTHYNLRVVDANGCEYETYGFTVYVDNTFPKVIEEGKRWNSISLGWGLVDANIEYKIEGDSFVNGMNYKVIKSISTYNNTWEVSHLLRETDNGKIFQYDYEENLLFDFSLTIGDSFEIETGYLIVVGEDSISLTNGEKRRMLELDCSNQIASIIWVEGIGCLTNGIHDVGLNHNCATDTETRLICHWDNEDLIYMNPYYDTCIVTVPTIEIENITYEVNIVPNPNDGVFSLDLPEIEDDVFLEIYDLSGRKLYDEYVQNNRVNLNLSHYNNGMYFLVLKNNQGTLFKEKFLVLK